LENTNQTTHSWKDWKSKDLIFGVIVPTIVAFLIVGIAMSSSVAAIALKYILLEAIVVVAVPMLIGLVWNQWAGGASGFLMGSLYTLYFADQIYASQGSGDISLLGNLVSAMLIGYVAGALNKRSDSYKRMLIASVTAGIMGSSIVIFTSNFSSILGPATIEGAFLAFLSRILTGVLVPLVGRAFLRHRVTQKKKE
jgi:membrane-associated HD superfamily phosphohydrolase